MGGTLGTLREMKQARHKRMETIRFYWYEAPGEPNAQRQPRGQAERWKRHHCLTGSEPQFCKVSFWKCACCDCPAMGMYLKPLNWTLKNGQCGRFSFMCILSQFKLIFFFLRLMPEPDSWNQTVWQWGQDSGLVQNFTFGCTVSAEKFCSRTPGLRCDRMPWKPSSLRPKWHLLV